MMKCEEAAQLISEQKDHELRWTLRLALRMHLALCRICRVYNRQLEMLGRIAAAAGDAVISRWPRGDSQAGLALSSEAKQRMKDRLSRPDSTS